MSSWNLFGQISLGFMSIRADIQNEQGLAIRSSQNEDSVNFSIFAVFFLTQYEVFKKEFNTCYTTIFFFNKYVELIP